MKKFVFIYYCVGGCTYERILFSQALEEKRVFYFYEKDFLKTLFLRNKNSNDLELLSGVFDLDDPEDNKLLNLVIEKRGSFILAEEVKEND